MSQVVRTIPGVTLIPSRFGSVVRLRGCKPLLWLDGVRLPGAELDELIHPSEVAALEVYPSWAGIPAQYFDRSATCGTILLWTRSR